MKKTAHKLTLNRETLRRLNTQNLTDAAGGTYPDPPSQATCIKTICPDQPAQDSGRSSCCANA